MGEDSIVPVDAGPGGPEDRVVSGYVIAEGPPGLLDPITSPLIIEGSKVAVELCAPVELLAALGEWLNPVAAGFLLFVTFDIAPASSRRV